MMNETNNTTNSSVQYDKIGGWLVLVGIGLVISPVVRLYGVYTGLLPTFSTRVWNFFTTPGSPGYHPLWAPALIYEFVGNILFGLAPFLLLIYFFRKQKVFPKFYIIYLVSQMVFLIGDYILLNSIPIVAQEGLTTSTSEVMMSLVGPLIWIRYFLVTDRVKGTFIN